jgi:hypothetical protein
MKQDTRPDCAVRIAAAKHRVRRVRSNRRCRQRWDGSWPGEADCERLGFFVTATARCPISTAYSPNASGTPTGNGGSGCCSA